MAMYTSNKEQELLKRAVYRSLGAKRTLDVYKGQFDEEDYGRIAFLREEIEELLADIKSFKGSMMLDSMIPGLVALWSELNNAYNTKYSRKKE